MNVLFEYIFTSRSQVQTFCRCLSPGTPVHLFTLWAPLKLVQDRESSRPNRAPLGYRLLDTYAAMERSLDQLGTLLNNTGSLEDTLGEIEAHLAHAVGPPAQSYLRNINA